MKFVYSLCLQSLCKFCFTSWSINLTHFLPLYPDTLFPKLFLEFFSSNNGNFFPFYLTFCFAFWMPQWSSWPAKLCLVFLGEIYIPGNFQLFISLSGFPHSPVGKEYACNAGDISLIPGSGRSTGEAIGYPLQSLSSGSFHKPLILLQERADRLKITITEN